MMQELTQAQFMPTSVRPRSSARAGGAVFRPETAGLTLGCKTGAMRSAACFLRDETGAITLEFTVLVPFFIAFMMFFIDASVIYLTHSEMFNVAREISRRISTGELQNQSDIEAYAADHLFLGGREYFVGFDFDGDKTVVLVVGLDHAAIFGAFFTPILGEKLVAVSTTAEEPRI